jgi:hypothetical protein
MPIKHKNMNENKIMQFNKQVKFKSTWNVNRTVPNIDQAKGNGLQYIVLVIHVWQILSK